MVILMNVILNITGVVIIDVMFALEISHSKTEGNKRRMYFGPYIYIITVNCVAIKVGVVLSVNFKESVCRHVHWRDSNPWSVEEEIRCTQQ